MKSVEELLSHLLRDGVTEVAMVAGRLPCANVNGKFEPLDKVSPSNEDLIALLEANGGESHIGSISERPAQWSFRVNGVGTVGVAVVERGGKIQCRMSLMKREAKKEEAPARARPPAIPALPKDESRPTPFDPRVDGPLEIEAAPDPFAAAPKGPSKAQPASPPAMPAAQKNVVRRAAGPVPANLKGITPLLAIALEANARDIHIVAARPLLVRVTTDLLARTEPLPTEEVDRIARNIVPPRLMQTLEQEGSCDFALEHPEFGRFRVNVSKQRTGMKVSMRVIPLDAPKLSSLGLPSALVNATHHHQGLVVITGPTGHGKTTTMAALVDHINSESAKHIITVEDPVEYMHRPARSVLSQREVGTHTKSFASALKGSLREDPDVIVVGELRDRETVHMAVSASETGHLVIGTMNTPSAAKTIDRLIDMFPPADQQQARMTLAGALRMIVSQRLVPSADGKKLHPAVEVLPGSIALYTLIRDNRTVQIPSLQQRGKASGSILLDESLGELVRSGKTTLEIAKEYADSPTEVENYVRGRAKNLPSTGEMKAVDGGLLGGLFKKKGA